MKKKKIREVSNRYMAWKIHLTTQAEKKSADGRMNKMFPIMVKTSFRSFTRQKNSNLSVSLTKH